MIRTLPIYIVIFLTGLLAHGQTSCDELNRLYVDKYVDAFVIDKESFEINDTAPLFKCNGTDKNFIMARAINDLELLRSDNNDEPDYYSSLAQILALGPNKTGIKYAGPHLGNSEASVRKTLDQNGKAIKSAIFIGDKFFTNGERFRPTYTLIHEVRHTLLNKTINGNIIPDEPTHTVCTHGMHKGLDVCDSRLTKETDLYSGSGNSHEFLFLIYLRSHPKATNEMKTQAQEQLNFLATHMFNKIDPGILDYYKVQLL